LTVRPTSHADTKVGVSDPSSIHLYVYERGIGDANG
jgi:hypothetical protein